MEKWKDIKSFEGIYQVSNFGRVKSLPRKQWNGRIYWTSKEKILKQTKDKRGYLLIGLHNNNKLITAKVHRLVGIHFIPNPQNKPEINHKNGIKIQNDVENLEWATSSENNKHAYDTKLRKSSKGEKNTLSKLTNKSVLEIREKYIPWKYTQAMLAKEYNVDASIISLIIRRKRWNDI